ncbi:MAG TPA: hypothetical protein VKW06_08970 [Candidatus Angelobacter sp.]|nr:hypothetical protein [Candidatus Angelobacter sp.]
MKDRADDPLGLLIDRPPEPTQEEKERAAWHSLPRLERFKAHTKGILMFYGFLLVIELLTGVTVNRPWGALVLAAIYVVTLIVCLKD